MGVKINKKLIGVRIMQRRKTAGLTQDELAEKVGLSPNHISNIECGKNLPTTKFILQVCSILGETPDYYLLGKVGEDTDEITRLVRELTPDLKRVFDCWVNLTPYQKGIALQLLEILNGLPEE